MQASATAARTVRLPLFAAKIALSAALIAYAVGKIEVGEASRQIRSVAAIAILAAEGLLFVQSSVAAFRLRQVLGMLGVRCRFVQALDVIFIGAFFSQTFASFVGGDAMRIWRLARSNISLSLATKAIALDRTAGLAGSLGLALLTLPFLLEVVREPVMRNGLVSAIVGVITAFVLVVLMKYIPAPLRDVKPIQWVSDFADITLSVTRSTKRLASLLALSLIIQLLNVVVIYVLARGLSIGITFWHTLLLVPPVLFLSMLPVSVAGWGVREGAMIAALGLVGVRPAASVAVSLCFGLSLIAISLPGAVLWLRHRGGVSRREHGEANR